MSEYRVDGLAKALDPRSKGEGLPASAAVTPPGPEVDGRSRSLADESGDLAVRALSLQKAGEAEYIEGRPKDALGPLRRALEIFGIVGDSHRSIGSLLLLARVEREMALLDEAESRTTEAMTLAREVGDVRAECEALNVHAGVVSAHGRHVEAIECLESALAMARELGIREQEAHIMSNLGNLRRQLGDYAGALDNLKGAYELLRVEAPGTRAEAVNLVNLGHLYREMGDNASAKDFFSRAREVGRLADDSIAEAASLNSLANVLSGGEEWSEAEALYDEALQVSRRNGLLRFEIDNLDGLGQVYAAKGDLQRAEQAHREALATARQIGDREGENDALLNLGRLFLTFDLAPKALPLLQQGLELAKQLGRKRSLFEAHELLAQAYEHTGDLRAALQHHKEFYKAEKVVFNEESEERVERLTVQFDVERARHEAETYRMRTEVEQQAREQAEAMVRERTRELEESQQEIVARLAIAGEYRDDGTGEHTRRVGRNAAAIARALGWKESEAELLYSAARLHDVGKIGIRDSVLLKPGKLSDEEFALMRAHTTIGGRILSGGQSKLLRMAEEIAFAHHERWDGKGYPMSLTGEEIPQSARIVSVSDVLDALTHERPYKEAWPVREALDEISRNSGTQFDPAVVAACLDVFSENGLNPTENVPATVVQRRGRPAGESDVRETSKDLERARREAEIAARRMQLVAFSDPLTGLGNKRAFEADLESEVGRSLRESQPLAVLVVDLDSLRLLNEAEGYQRGDELLRAFAGAVHLKLGGMGRIYRLSGDGFGAVLNQTTRLDPAIVMRRLQEAVEVTRSSGFDSVAVSSGLAVFKDDATTVGELLRLSEQRLYRDKLESHGRRNGSE